MGRMPILRKSQGADLGIEVAKEFVSKSDGKVKRMTSRGAAGRVFFFFV
jgi:hypothetical protein